MSILDLEKNTVTQRYNLRKGPIKVALLIKDVKFHKLNANLLSSVQNNTIQLIDLRQSTLEPVFYSCTSSYDEIRSVDFNYFQEHLLFSGGIVHDSY